MEKGRVSTRGASARLSHGSQVREIHPGLCRELPGPGQPPGQHLEQFPARRVSTWVAATPRPNNGVRWAVTKPAGSAPQERGPVARACPTPPWVLARHFDLSRRACDPPLYEDRVMRQPRIAYFGCTLALQPKHSPLLPTLAYHFTGTFILNSFSAFRNAIFSLSSRGKSTPRNQSVCSFMSANG